MIKNNLEKGYVQIYTGNGKGKTTAALGLTARAVGNNFKVFFCQFMKGKDYGELKTLASFPTVKHERYGRGIFIRKKENVTDEDISLMRSGYESLKSALLSGEYDIIIADEIIGTLKFDLISIDEIKFLIKNKPNHVELILTGRNAPEELIELADLVTEMREVKHYFQKGVYARVGIEK
ncbi:MULTISPECIES: cob(I)yrinic acid a,c-diamide adenosyltransferase [Fusobacterium]|uniref:cob(I)yrinic acid a,c-diamide adenosyltransferase n=3 Tax=Fusobacteriaceae TaxID=203492 RepID=UPI001F500431|nr:MULTISPECIES: cob(I)yrinic acid a,c-diamide adenosyltransferase [Fusobacterium]MDD7409871.1 cob(I)yrinic acid a,c-diamide adenosyltransferase [Fusobacteriaceae bacterium]MCI7224201.1 cob(I)yrinic acid a,c-diamide adenosyltransferase [Fusobacterium sp.]MDY5306614.1 cob(I)yrinic acid a,c-diamide adenosyltransferase [Fusobacterium gastrosuis]MDY5712452.1 cob(I)yrinic acid a,c-diamide adenosyltransferase [Fusobacterium gastrosuis]MDY5795297.1 cob(I)yrinic acid a,c-diamide adenosyltransferase [F